MNTFSDIPGFDDGKDPQALRTIGEVTKALGIRQHVLRYWEEQFPMLQPIKRSGGRRYYRPEDVALIVRIDRLVHHEGYTLRGARKAIEEGSSVAAPVQSEAAVLAAPPVDDTIVEDLRRIRGQLAVALAEA